MESLSDLCVIIGIRIMFPCFSSCKQTRITLVWIARLMRKCQRVRAAEIHISTTKNYHIVRLIRDVSRIFRLPFGIKRLHPSNGDKIITEETVRNRRRQKCAVGEEKKKKIKIKRIAGLTVEIPSSTVREHAVDEVTRT